MSNIDKEGAKSCNLGKKTGTEFLSGISESSGYVYVLVDYNLIDTYKIGITTRNIQKRLKELNQSPGSAVKLLFLSPLTGRYKVIEKQLHRVFKNCNTYSGLNSSLSEWFLLPEFRLQELDLILRYEFKTGLKTSS